jgi:hypothetical protein
MNIYKNKNEKLNKYIVGYKEKRPEYKIYLDNIKTDKFPLIRRKNKTFNINNYNSPRQNTYSSNYHTINKNI